MAHAVELLALGDEAEFAESPQQVAEHLETEVGLLERGVATTALGELGCHEMLEDIGGRALDAGPQAEPRATRELGGDAHDPTEQVAREQDGRGVGGTQRGIAGAGRARTDHR